MIWVFVCNNMYRYQHHFGLLYRNPPRNSKNFKGRRFRCCQYWNGSTEHGRIFVFIEIQRQGINQSPMCLCEGKMWKSNVKNIFHIISRVAYWPVGVSNHVVLKFSRLRHHLPCQHGQHSRESERQNIIDKTHTWQQCLVIISEDISKTKYDFDLR